MKITCKNQTIEVWQVSQEISQPKWVQIAFEKNEFQWDGNRLKVLTNVFRPSIKSFLTGFWGIGIQVNYANIGDFVKFDDGKIIRQRNYEKIRKRRG